MIGSLMSRMADAEKLSIPQLNQAVKNGTIPAYVGVPLIQEKMKAEQAAKAMVAQTQAQPPLARQVMEQADMMSGLEKLQSNLPEEGFAGGGIVAFADGGETEGYADGGQIDMGNGYNPFANLPPMSGPLGAVGGQRPAGMQPMGASDGVNPFSPERMTALRNNPEFLETMRVSGGGYDQQGRAVDGLGNMINQPTGQSTFPGAAAVQSGFGQGAQGYPSFAMGSGGFGGGGSGGPFPLEGQYGIVKMAEGGVSTPDDDEDEEKNLMSRLMAGITSLKQGVSDRIPSSDAIKQSIVSKMPSGMRSAVYDGPQKGDYVSPPAERRARGGHKYENLVAAEAERIGLDPNIAVHALYKETGNLKNPESARSRAGALGVMQLMPKTAKELGVDPLNPEDNIRGGVMYLKQMYDKYQDPTLALAAYNAGPGRVDKALKSGRGIEGLPRETQNYVMARNMAGGGIVAFSEGGTSMPEVDFEATDPMTGMPYAVQSPFEALGRSARGGKPIKEYYKEKPVAPAEKKPEFKNAPVPMTGPTDQELGRTPPKDETAAALSPYKEPAADQGISDIKSLLKQRMEESGKQKRIDAYMSLLQAGLGMMGGSSPFASVNIGQGAAQGVAAQMAARKSQVADENAILTGQLGLSRAELYEKMRRDALKQQAEKDLAAQKLGQQRLGVQQQAQNIRMGDLRRKASEDWDNSPRKAQLEADLTKQKKNWRQDTKLLGQYEAMRNRFINEFVNVGQADNILSSSQL